MKVSAPHLPTVSFLDEFSNEELAKGCKGLAHPARVAILKHLIAVDACVCGRIVEVVGLAQSTVSQHLKVLKEAGLVRGEVNGPATCYCVDKQALANLIAALEGL